MGKSLLVFEIPTAEKGSYKGYGKSVIDKQGTLDRDEFYNVGTKD